MRKMICCILVFVLVIAVFSGCKQDDVPQISTTEGTESSTVPTTAPTQNPTTEPSLQPTTAPTQKPTVEITETTTPAKSNETGESPYPIFEISDERVITTETKKVFSDSWITLRIPKNWKCLESTGEDGRIIYFQDPLWGTVCQVSLRITGSEYKKERTYTEWLEYLTDLYGNATIDSFTVGPVAHFPCTKVVSSYSNGNKKFIRKDYYNLVAGVKLYDFTVVYPASESKTYESTFDAIIASVEIIKTNDVDISSWSLDEAYAIAAKAYADNPQAHRDIGELQLETGQIVEIDGKYYQSFVASNVDHRYIWISRSEFPDERQGPATWDWYPAGTANVYSLELLGKIDEGRR